MSGFVVVRPEPGNAATVAHLRAAGRDVLAQPLFAVAPLAWTPPDPARFDALLITSANTLRHGGEGLRAMVQLPVVAVGAATAAAARDAGFTVRVTGRSDARAAVAMAAQRGFTRLLHLGGRHRSHDGSGHETIAVYSSDLLPALPAMTRAWHGRTILLHSARAAPRVAALIAHERESIALVALSEPILAAAGHGWRAMAAAAEPTDAALLDLAMRTAD